LQTLLVLKLESTNNTYENIVHIAAKYAKF